MDDQLGRAARLAGGMPHLLCFPSGKGAQGDFAGRNRPERHDHAADGSSFCITMRGTQRSAHAPATTERWAASCTLTPVRAEDHWPPVAHEPERISVTSCQEQKLCDLRSVQLIFFFSRGHVPSAAKASVPPCPVDGVQGRFRCRLRPKRSASAFQSQARLWLSSRISRVTFG